MYTHPYLARELARERQRDMVAQADQQRLARQLRDLGRASHRAERAERLTIQSLKRLTIQSLKRRPTALPS